VFVGSLRECQQQHAENVIHKIRVKSVNICECGHNSTTLSQYTHGGVCLLCGGKI
jgi:hypothetical protein